MRAAPVCGEHKWAEASATSLSTSPHLAPKGSQGAASSLLASLGKESSDCVNRWLAEADQQGGGGLGRLSTWRRACTSAAPHRKSIAVGCAAKA